ncbi:response regulator [Carboxylicivirga taeanensis]|uniref:response regulator n=1 Tax=Carboxylicivirga taeanensis TaxID=1416875 RepID=UPI003F6DA7AE
MKAAKDEHNKAFKEVVIVDDQNLFAEGITTIINGIKHVKVTATLDTGEKLTEKLSLLKPDVLFLDLNLPGKNGLEILKAIRSRFPEMIIAILTIYEDAYLVRKIKESKANAYLSKRAGIEELETVIFSAPDSPFYLSEDVQTSQSTAFELANDDFTVKAQITQREKEIIRLIVNGKSTEEISEALIISYETVKSHRKNIFRKLKLNKVTELIKYAYEHQLL